jgi:Flp pilus assembly protein TadG
MKKRGLKELNGDKRGAVLVEFAVAFMPLMITFSAFVQLQQMATARLVVKHSAIVGARAAAVISNKARNTPDAKGEDNVDEVKAGVMAALGPWKNTMANVNVTVDDTSTCEDPYGMVSVTVTADYKCSVPFSNIFMCGAAKKHTFKPMVSRFPHQGARYQEGDGAKGCSGG